MPRQDDVTVPRPHFLWCLRAGRCALCCVPHPRVTPHAMVAATITTFAGDPNEGAAAALPATWVVAAATGQHAVVAAGAEGCGGRGAGGGGGCAPTATHT